MVHVCGLGIVDVRECYHGVLILVECYLPYPVAAVGSLVNHGVGVCCCVAVSLVYVEHTVSNVLQSVALDVLQYRAIALVHVNNIEVQPVGIFVVRMSCGICQVYLVLAVAVVFCVWPCARALYNLLRAEVHLYVVVLVGHGEPCHSGMPVDATPAEVYVLRVIAEDER